MEKKESLVWIAAGGTGGHIFPAEALAQSLKEKGIEVLFLGKGLSSNRYFSKKEFPFVDIDGSPLAFRKLLKSLLSIFKGTRQACRLSSPKKPDLVVGFGSYHSFPILIAAKIKRIPFVLFESNSVPGRVNAFFSPSALVTAVQFPPVQKKMRGRFEKVCFPLRKGDCQELFMREKALAYFGLEEGVRTFLVFGGSQGAVSLNGLCMDAFKELQGSFQVIHLIGQKTSLDEAIRFYQEQGIKACVKLFEEKIELAWSIADLAICRAGASTCAEILFFAVPAILIPYPQAKDAHQLKNGIFMSEEVQGTICLEESILTSHVLSKQIADFSIEKKKESLCLYKKHKNGLSLEEVVSQCLSKKGKKS